MHPQLQEIIDDFRNAQKRLHQLAETVVPASWAVRPAPGRWSVSECVAHLNLTTAAFRAPVEGALTDGRRLERAAPSRYHRDPVGWFLWRIMPPPVRLMRVKTSAACVPNASDPRDQVVAQFDRLQEEQIGWVRAADGLPLAELRVTSPFNASWKYNLFACLSILPRHQHRHLWQAEQAWAALRDAR